MLLFLLGCTWISKDDIERRLADGCTAEVWYDGIDQDCDGRSDFDKDGDGVESAAHGGIDCWDDPEVVPEGFEAVAGFAQPGAADVYPGADDSWYDGVDQDCDGGSDFDQDGDGFDSATWPDADGGVGDDCFDSADDDYPVSGEVLAERAPEEVNPGATEEWYDGTDQDCDGASDYDQDADGFDIADECDDEDPERFPNPDIDEVWYDDVDDDCDGNLYDKDLDGHVHAEFGGDDCWDDPEAVPEGFDAMPGFSQPAAEEVYPSAVDTPYDGVDGDCAGDADFDADGDGYPTDAWPDREGEYGLDCDDADDDVNPGAPDDWYDGVDADCGGESDYDADGDGFDAGSGAGADCDDTLATIHPDAAEDCGTAYDDDCDGVLDAEGATGCDTFFLDADGDGYGAASSQCWCEPPVGSDFDATRGGDCDDAVASVNPGGSEVCDAADTDEDCDGAADDADASVSGGTRYFHDNDADGFGDEDHAGATYCDDPSTETERWSADATDCDDAAPGTNPAAAEATGDGEDQDCDGAETCYVDADGDAYRGTGTVASTDLDCEDAGEAWASAGPDCNDDDPSSAVGGVEVVGDGIDQDCDGVDSCYQDADGDNYGTTVVVDGSSLSCVTGTGASVSTDCNDASSAAYPGAAEVVADGVDQDCDSVDSCYQDSDGDNYGTTTVVDGSTLSCATGTGAPVSTDCNDASTLAYPGATETVADGIDQDCDSVDSCYQDADGDNYGTSTIVDGSSLSCATGTGAANDDDCNDASSTVHPGASETVADGIDQDCDSVDSCYTDADGDNYGTTVVVDGSSLSCSTGTGAPVSTDCNDASASVYPGATETVADGIDQDCDSVDSCYTDADGDNYGTTVAVDGSSLSCATGTGAPVSTDCDDADASDHPGATETVGNQDDESCDGTEICYDDDDNDGFLDSSGDTRTSSDTDCNDANEGTNTDLTTDCNDASALIYPGATEVVGDGVDQSCDGSEICYDDDDNDGYLDTSGDTRASADTDCSDANEGTNTDATTDCNDSNASRRPGAAETCNDIDDDCDGSADEGLTAYYTDADGDGYGTGTGDCSVTGATSGGDCDDSDEYVYPGARELCDGQANDCADTSWTEDDENQVVSYVTTAGVWSDVSTSFDDATATSYSLPSSGTLYFCAGTYYTKLVAISGSTASMVGFYGAESTVLDNNTSTGSTVSVTNASLTLDGLTIRGGHGTTASSVTYGGGVLANASSRSGSPTLSLVDCIVEANAATRGAGLAAYTSAWVRLEGTTVQGNDGTNGGGAWVGSGALLEVLSGSTITGNTALEGGGVYASGAGGLTIDDSEVEGNEAEEDGAGIWIDNGDATCTSSVIFDNWASGHGGGVYIRGDGTFASTACEFGSNSPSDVEIQLTSSSWETYTYGATATFLCSGIAGICY